MIDKALEFARKAHAGQVDKAGKDYIQHPLHVASRLSGEKEKVVALLHDVVEDSAYTLDDLKALDFPDEILSAVDAITKRAGEPYSDYIARVKANDIARRVKIEDVRHNMDLTRIGRPIEKDFKRAEKYRDVLIELQS